MSRFKRRLLGGQRELSDLLWDSGRLLLIASLLFVVIVPVVFAISMSFRSAANFYSPIWIPEEPTLEWYERGFRDLIPLLKNSYLRALGSTLITLVVTIPAGYAFARREFKYKTTLFLAVVGVMLFPVIIVAIPFTVAFYDLGLQDTIVSLWVVDLMLMTPLAVYLLRDYFAALPDNIEEAAQVYGCTSFTAFVRVVLPLAVPGILAVGFFTFVIGWNEFLFALLLTQQNAQPAIVDLNAAVSSEASLQQGMVMAKTIIISIPPAVLYLFARRSLMKTF